MPKTDPDPEPTIVFQIPMRGNERMALDSDDTGAGAFQIPMRGNEFINPDLWRTDAARVPNPHEG